VRDARGESPVRVLPFRGRRPAAEPHLAVLGMDLEDEALAAGLPADLLRLLQHELLELLVAQLRHVLSEREAGLAVTLEQGIEVDPPLRFYVPGRPFVYPRLGGGFARRLGHRPARDGAALLPRV